MPWPSGWAVVAFRVAPFVCTVRAAPMVKAVVPGAPFSAVSRNPATLRGCSVSVELAGGGAPPSLKWTRLHVVVQEELVRVGAQLEGLQLDLSLVVDVGLDQVLGEDAVLEQKLVVRLERVQRLGE